VVLRISMVLKKEAVRIVTCVFFFLQPVSDNHFESTIRMRTILSVTLKNSCSALRKRCQVILVGLIRLRLSSSATANQGSDLAPPFATAGGEYLTLHRLTLLMNGCTG
jgi:hypothetical protein